MDPHESDLDGSMSNNDEDLSEPDLQDEEDSVENVLRIPTQPSPSSLNPDTIAKIKQTGDEGPLKGPVVGSGPPNSLGNGTNVSSALAAAAAAAAAVNAAAAGNLIPPLSFSLPPPFPFSHPGTAAFLPPISNSITHSTPSSGTPAPVAHSNNNNTNNNNNNNNAFSSASSHSSESSSSSQQTWSFEEQFKQVRQMVPEQNHVKNGVTNGHTSPISINLSQELYEINDDPKRKEFLDDLFSFMQKRGTPINRLPIMAKSVLDLYELYNLVIARGGLVDVINKKLWQEIIKGLHLPSSITSAAFTLRTQYMKYLYPYECEKRGLSTPHELQQAIDGNRREGRRSSYGAYNDLVVQRSPGVANSMQSSQMTPLSLVTSGRPMMNGTVGGGNGHGHAAPVHHPAHHQHHPNALHHLQGLHPPQPQPAIAAPGTFTQNDLLAMQMMLQGPIPGLAPTDLDTSRMMEYLKLLNKEFRNTTGSHSPPPQMINNRQGSSSPPSSSSPQQDPFNNIDMSRLTLWNLYSNNPAAMAAAAAAAANANLVPTPNLPPTLATTPSAPVEPQKEALNLGVRENTSSTPSSVAMVNEQPSGSSLPPVAQVKREVPEGARNSSPKRLHLDDDSDIPTPKSLKICGTPGAHIKISSSDNPEENSLVVSMDLNGVVYQGVLFAKNARNSHTS